MKSKVILFCVVLFCSQIVDSIPRRNGRHRQRVNSPAQWHVDQNAPNAEYLDTDSTQTRNVKTLTNPAIDQESTQNDYSNQGMYNNNVNDYNKSPVGSTLSSSSGQEDLRLPNAQANRRSLDSYSQEFDSIPRRDGRLGQRGNMPTKWQVNQNTPNAEYLDNDSTQTRNVQTLINPANDQESSRNYYSNLFNNNGYEYNKSPSVSEPSSSVSSSSLSGANGLVLSNEQADGRSLDSYSPIVESYPSQVDSQQFRNKNWRPQNHYTNSAPSPVLLPTDNGSPSVNTVQDPYGLQYFQPSYAAPTNRRVYQPNRSNFAGESFQHSLAHNAGDSFVANSGFGSSGPVPYKNYLSRSDLSNTAHSNNYDNNSPLISEEDNNSSDSGSNNDAERYIEGKSVASEIKASINAGRRQAQRFPSQTGTNYNKSPAVIGTETLDYRSRNIFSDTDDDEMISANDNYSTGSRQRSGPVHYERFGEDQAVASEAKPKPKGGRKLAQKNPAHLNIGKKNVDISKILFDTPLAQKYARNYRSDSGTTHIDDSYDGIPAVISETIEEQSGNNEYGSSGSTPSNTNLNQNIYQKALGMKDINLNKLVTQPEMQKFLSESDSRFLIIHPNGTVENVNTIDLDSHQNSKLRLVNTKGKNVADTEGDGTQSPDIVPNNNAKTSVPVDESSLHTNNQPAHVNQTNTAKESDSNLPNKDLPGDQTNLNPLTPLVNQPGVNDTNSSSPRENKPAVDEATLPSNENQPDYYNALNPHRRLPAGRKKFRHSHGNQPINDEDSGPFYSDENQPSGDNNSQLLPSKENQSDDGVVRRPHRRHRANRKSKPSEGNQPTDGSNNSIPMTPDENQMSDAKNSKPLPSKENQSENDSNSKHSDESQQGDDNKYSPKIKPSHHIKRKPSPVNLSADNDTSPENKPRNNNNYDSLSEDENQSDDENQAEDDKSLKPLRPYEKQSTDDSKPSLPGVNETDEQSDSTTLSPTIPNDTTSLKSKKPKHRHHHRKSTTSSPIVYFTTPSSGKTSEDQIITLSPIEQVTDNVSDVPVSTTTTTAKPIETGKTDTTEDANNKKGDEQEDASSSSENLASILDKLQTSTTTVSPSSSTTPKDNTTDDKTKKQTAERKDTQTNDKTIKSQGNNGKNDIQTVQSAVYDSSELLDTNNDVPAESDDYSPVTTSPSVYNEVDSGDASGDNTLELEQPETDITITVSSSTDNDSEDEIITINIEISESTGLSGNDKTLVVSIDTDNDDDDDTKTTKSSGSGSQSSDCNKDHNDDGGRGKNLEIDMSNIQGEPTVWIRTTNQDFIDKLTDKNDTSFDVVYYFNINNQPAIEREKETTIHCNGTVVIESKEITYANKDDPTPTITKTMQTIQIEDYKQFGLDLS